MYVNVFFVIRCLYSAVSLTLVKEQRFIIIIIIIIIYAILWNRTWSWHQALDADRSRFVNTPLVKMGPRSVCQTRQAGDRALCTRVWGLCWPSQSRLLKLSVLLRIRVLVQHFLSLSFLVVAGLSRKAEFDWCKSLERALYFLDSGQSKLTGRDWTVDRAN